MNKTRGGRVQKFTRGAQRGNARGTFRGAARGMRGGMRGGYGAPQGYRAQNYGREPLLSPPMRRQHNDRTLDLLYDITSALK